MTQLGSKVDPIAQKIEYLRQVEIHLGNIPKQQDNWQSNHLEKYHVQTYVQSSLPLNDSVAEMLFAEIAVALYQQGAAPEEIASRVNAVLSYSKGPRYCDLGEVEDALRMRGHDI
ncbi:MAG: hypothetical protein OXT67_08480 [Zetaproteobacteria bacterium]|nr:hypothetical protein [Zetaproteobacteria bacterium]